MSSHYLDDAFRRLRFLEEENATLRKMLHYISFVLTGTENGDVQLAADRVACEKHLELAQLANWAGECPYCAVKHVSRDLESAQQRRVAAQEALDRLHREPPAPVERERIAREIADETYTGGNLAIRERLYQRIRAALDAAAQGGEQ